MKLITPDYYDDFTCIADRCRHSCCIGWEIDIDEETLKKYRNVSGDFGIRLREGIETDACGTHFCLGEHERCPFLNKDGLCDIILTLGEDYLSQICTDHPRFCSFYSDRTELGLGLCCEEAARIILFKQTQTKFSVWNDDGEQELPTEEEKAFFAKKERLLALAQDRSKTILERIQNLKNETGAVLPDYSIEEWAQIFLSLEHMDPAWEMALKKVKEKNFPAWRAHFPETAMEQLLVYFIYRHVSDPKRNLAGPVLFAILSVFIIRVLFDYFCRVWEKDANEKLVEVCRLYSSEIEYSEENTERLISLLEESCQKNEGSEEFRHE